MTSHISTYRRTSLDDPSASQLERIAAATDYVGAVYLEEGVVRYDGKLTDEERANVIRALGNITGSTEYVIDELMRQGRLFFLNHLTIPVIQANQCGDVSYKKMENLSLGQAHVLSGGHDCGLFYGGLYFANGVERKVAAHPEQWLFFVEGHALGIPGAETQELLLFQRISKVLGIPLANPLPQHTTSPAAISHAVAKYHHERSTYILSVFTIAFIANVNQRPAADRVAETTRIAEQMHVFYGVDPMALLDNYFCHVRTGAWGNALCCHDSYS